MNSKYSLKYVRENYGTDKLLKEAITGEFLFFFMIENKCDSNSVRELSEITNIGVSSIKMQASKYKKYANDEQKSLYEELVHKEDTKIQKKIQKRIYEENKNTLYKKVIETIYDSKTMEDAINYLKQEDITLSLLKRHIISYRIRATATMTKTDAEQIIKKAIKCYNAYEKSNFEDTEQRKLESINRRKEKQTQEKKLKLNVASGYVSAYASFLPMTKEEFCTKNHIKVEELDEFINTARKNKLEAYTEYRNKVNSQKLSNPETAKQVKLIRTLLMSGIEENDGNIRKFELLDYYEITKMNLLEFFDLIVDDLSLKELRVIKAFVMNNSQIKETTREKIGKYRMAFTINGQEVVESNNDRHIVLDDLEKKQIPLSDVVYKQALKKYIKTKINN